MNKKNRLFLVFAVLIVGGVLIGQYLLRGAGDFGHSGHSHQQGSVYTCPMHPEIRENQPGSCPICHMSLVKVASENNKEIRPSKQSRVSIEVSPYQASLVGIRPVKAESKKVSFAIAVSGRIISGSSLALQVFESDLRFIKKGVAFHGASAIYPEKLIRGKITFIDSIVDPSSRTIRVVGKIASGGKNLISESSFTGTVDIDLGNQIVIPEQAVLFTGKGSFVYKYNDQKLVAHKVILGAKVKEDYVVVKGLAVGDSISSGPNFLIDSESKIRGL